jgi:hypothetical protein
LRDFFGALRNGGVDFVAEEMDGNRSDRSWAIAGRGDGHICGDNRAAICGCWVGCAECGGTSLGPEKLARGAGSSGEEA